MNTSKSCDRNPRRLLQTDVTRLGADADTAICPQTHKRERAKSNRAETRVVVAKQKHGWVGWGIKMSLEVEETHTWGERTRNRRVRVVDEARNASTEVLKLRAACLDKRGVLGS